VAGNGSVRAEGFDILNRANLSFPNTALGVAAFGQVIATEDARKFQFAGRIYF
jgi:hypothetical protein